MYIFKKEPTFKFINKRYYAFALSGLIILAGMYLYLTRGFNWGIDFSGGTLVEVSFADRVSVQQVRRALGQSGLGDAQITQIGNENKFFIKAFDSSGKKTTIQEMEDHERLAKLIKGALLHDAERAALNQGKIDLNNNSEGEIATFLRSQGITDEDARDSAQKIIQLRKEATGIITDYSVLEKAGVKHRISKLLQDKSFLSRFTILSVEIVGPQVGKDLRRKATLACIWALIGMLLYIAFRFKFLYGLSGILTLTHDVLVALSFILFFNLEMSLQVIAAILTIVGYSINDTIVVFDRLRENLKIMKKESLEVILDKSLNQTLSRSIFTSFTVFLTVMAIFLFGGEVIHGFAFVMLVGVIAGSYSTIFQSCAWLKVWEKTFLKRKK